MATRLESLVGPKQDTLNQAWKEDKSGFGFKMLMKMGWSEGRGLGKELQGAATHVTVAKKTDSAGLGAEKDDTGNLRWTEASANFDSVLSRLNAAYGGDAAAAKKAEKRRKKKEKKEKERAEQSPAAVAGKASMLLRHPKLLKSKNIRAYSAHDMQAILGIHRSSTTTATATTTTITTAPASSPWASLAGVGTTSRSATVVTRTEEEVDVVVVKAAEEEKSRRKKDKKRKRERGEGEKKEAAAAEEKEGRKERKKAKKSKKEKRRSGEE